MDFTNPEAFDLFLDLYGRLPRAGPGSDHCTRRAVALLPNGHYRTVLDLGCGPGAQTLSLTRALPDARLVALDLVPMMTAETKKRCRDNGVSERVAVAIADMAAPPVSAASQDLIWCEGAIYNLGVAEALRLWRPLLSEPGLIAFTEPVWLDSQPDDEIHRWWLQEYPSMTDETGVRDAVAEAGFGVVDFFVLPSEAWWNDYYGPLEQRITRFARRYSEKPLAAEIIAMAEEEIAMFRRYSSAYSYGFFIVEPRPELQPGPPREQIP